MLLRKTRAESVEPVIDRVFSRYPTLAHLASASQEDLEEIIRPLGLQRIRSRAIIDAAGELMEKHGGRVPAEINHLLSLPHVGRYVANATLLFAFNEPRPVVDANVVRVFSRVFGTGKPVEVHKADDLWDFAADLTPHDDAQHFWLGVLDHAAIICKPRNPLCASCPVAQICQAYQAGKV